MEEVTKQKGSTVPEVLKRIADRYLQTVQPCTQEDVMNLGNFFNDCKTYLVESVGLEEKIGTSQVTNVGKNLVNSTR